MPRPDGNSLAEVLADHWQGLQPGSRSARNRQASGADRYTLGACGYPRAPENRPSAPVFHAVQGARLLVDLGISRLSEAVT